MNMPRMMEYRAAMTAASVGVKAPEKMPPMMSIGVSSGQNACLNARLPSAADVFGALP